MEFYLRDTPMWFTHRTVKKQSRKIKLDPHNPERTTVSTLLPLIEVDFLDNIAKICEQGLSFRGWQFLIQPLIFPNDPGNCTVDSWAVEVLFERIRQLEFPDKPSRFQAFLCWDKVEDFGYFEKVYAIRVKAISGHFKLDSSLLKLSVENARRYWSGEKSQKPKWEYLLKSPIEIIRVD